MKPNVMALHQQAAALLLFLLSIHESVLSDNASDELDFVPDFFGGRRNDDGGNGMSPPIDHRPPQRRSGARMLVRWRNFTQKLDHLNKCNRKVWNQRYLINDAYFEPRPNGPIFIRIGGEGAIDEQDLESGPFVQLAKQHRGLLLELEHRFYGESKPTSDTKVKNLRYLSSRQALADLENFITGVKKEYRASNPNPKFVLYGCSYSGSLAAFHRRLYPNSTSGAIAAFAPMFAVAEFQSYIYGFWEAMKNQGEDCALVAQAAIWLLTKEALNITMDNSGEDTTATDDQTVVTPLSNTTEIDDTEDYEEEEETEPDIDLHAQLNLCKPRELNFSDQYAIASMHYDLLARLMNMAQYNRKHLGENSELGTFCQYMLNETKGLRPVARFVAWRKEVDGRCIIHHGKSIQTLRSDWDYHYVKSGTRQWLYQMCSEFGYFTGSDTDEIYNIGYYMQTCRNSFGITDLEGNANRTNEFYGGLEGMNATNIYLLSSKADPWFYANTIEESRNPTMSVRVLREISHCYEPIGDSSDPKELVEAWKDIGDQVAKWIGM